MPYDVVKVDDGYKVCKKARTLKAKKECLSNRPLSKSNARQQQKAVYASESGGPSSNRNKANAKWQVLRGKTKLMSGVTAKQLAPNVSQMSGVGATQIIAALKNGAYHNFGPVTVSLIGDNVGEGVLSWLNKKLGQSSLFKPSTAASAQPQQVKDGLKLEFPADTKTLFQMNMNVYENKQENVADWRFMEGTKTVQFYGKNRDIIVAIRGSYDLRDVVTDIKIAFQNLRNSERTREDFEEVEEFQSRYPKYRYYFTGHSLAGAIIDLMMDDGLGISAISFNPAVEKNYYNSTNHRRIYNTEDPVYQLMGQYVPSAEVRPFKQQSGFLNKALSYVPIYGDVRQMAKGHSLLNYSGGRMMPISFVDRPHLRGPNMLMGSGFFDDLINTVAKVAVPAMTLGTLTAADLRKGNYKPDISRLPGYVLKSGERALRAKSGDPSGIVEAFTEEEGSGRWVTGVGGSFFTEEDPMVFCPSVYDPVQDEEGNFYSNSCEMNAAKNRRRKII